MNQTQAEKLKHDIEMTAFKLWLLVHGTGNGASKWMADAGLDKAVKALIRTINNGAYDQKKEYEIQEELYGRDER